MYSNSFYVQIWNKTCMMSNSYTYRLQTIIMKQNIYWFIFSIILLLSIWSPADAAVVLVAVVPVAVVVVVGDDCVGYIAVSFHPMLLDAGNNHLAAQLLLSKIFHSQGYLVAHPKKQFLHWQNPTKSYTAFCKYLLLASFPGSPQHKEELGNEANALLLIT